MDKVARECCSAILCQRYARSALWGQPGGRTGAHHAPSSAWDLRGIPAAHILNHMVQYQKTLDAAFAAVADPTRRGILEKLGRRDVSITELATAFGMTPTGMKKHVKVLEGAGLVV